MPFAHFLFKGVDIWHAQGYFLQISILLLYCFKLSKRSKPLACLLAWSGLLTTFIFYSIQAESKQYAITIFLPFFNLLCGVILFDCLTTFLKKDFFSKYLKYFSISVILITIYAVLQKYKLDQFYNGLANGPDEIVGVIGNPMHLAHYLAICLPVFFLLEKRLCKLGILFILLVIVLTKSTSGLGIALTVIIIGQCLLRVFTVRELCSMVWLVALIVFLEYMRVSGGLHNFIASNGRVEIWQKFLPIFQKKPITGWGLGTVNAFAQQAQFSGWRHLHNEYYHYALELGLIGFGIIIWGVIDYGRKFIKGIKDNTSISMALMFLAFCLAALFGYPSHLWVISGLAILAYSYQYLEA
mgnify:FL=1